MALITYLTRIQFDHGALGLLGDELSQLGISKPLILTDKGLMQTGLVDRLRDAWPGGAAAPLFDDTPANPTEEAAEQAARHFIDEKCDGIIGFGGGSSMDLAKAVAVAATHPGSLAQYAFIEGGAAKLTDAVAPVIAIPTTAGTGSEVGRAAIIIMKDGRKLAIVGPNMIPKLALCDPDLTLDLPAGLTAATGLDALAHCVETYCSPLINPPADSIALDGVGRVAGYLKRAVTDGHDKEARWNMMMASMEGAMAFQKGLGAVHALSHPLGAIRKLNMHHGTLNAVVMPDVLRFNADHTGDKYDRLSDLLGAGGAGALPDWMARFNSDLDMPDSLGAMGVTPEMLPDVAAAAVLDHCTATNPRPASADDYLAMLTSSLG